MLIDQHGEQKGILGRGEHKSFQTDRVILVPGPDDEVAVVRRIFEMFIQEEKTERQIAAALNQQQIASEWGRPWTRGMVNQILTSEKYIGHNIYNRVSFKLKKKRVQNPPGMWIRAENAFTPIIKPQLFYTAHGIILERNRRFSDDEMLSRLKTLVDRHQRISGILIDETDDLPSSAAYCNRFGSLVRAYRLIGYSPQHDYEYIEINRQLRRMHPEIVEDTMARIQAIGGEIERDPESDLLLINDEYTVSIVLSRCRQTGTGSMRWLVRLDQSLRPDITVVVRMCPTNDSVTDYYLLPWVDICLSRLWLAQDNGATLDTYRFDDLAYFWDLARRSRIEVAA